MLKTVLFDLDGTLLPMNQDEFTKTYFKAICAEFSDIYPSQKLAKAIWAGSDAMVKNDGKLTNEQVFWRKFTAIMGADAINKKPAFNAFYENGFSKIKAVCGQNSAAADLVSFLKERGVSLVIASSPIFPLTAQAQRVCWAGLNPNDFAHITAYENCRFCKPNVQYYRQLLYDLSLDSKECLMVGNDAVEDTPALQAGIDVFLLTDCLINPKGADISAYPNGNFARLKEYIRNLLR